MDKPVNPKWYYNIWFVLFMLFFVVGPLGLPLVWKSPHFARWVKIALTLAMVVYTVVLIQMTIRAVRTAMDHINQLNLSF